MASEGSTIVRDWPQEARQAAQIVIDTYGEPHEATGSVLTWHHVGPWKRVHASRAFHAHEFPVPHIDSVESVIDYRVPVGKTGELARFDGSVVVDRTAGEVSARCHDEQANLLALNLMNDIVAGTRDADAARDYYATEFLNVRRGQPTPYMEELRFATGTDTPDRDRRVLSDADLRAAAPEGR